ncbi:sulfurtransferase complex subunit TusD [Thalassotalea sp. 1_MG-2023]|uniref:sulfurtransferase complex subunit TusD n=1 Tax=Thalassotalea sp. 1_MG-2023 TaxID=3062680 RepID=UPI0026E137A8|nr:sulfurtransferase complex subunit TusD [Thalassotalea sp. 1_MG-2023]MDO6428861.1 sulfurtransferase complex subunit TusD [Thalassotalea sp. 1_MG-2023]
MNKIAVIITTPPTSHLTKTALQFVEDAAEQFNVLGIFFYQSGVLNAARNIDISSDEVNIAKQWSTFAHQRNIPMHLCSTAAERFGLTCYLQDGQPAKNTLQDGFQPSGLGELVTLMNNADKVVQL